MGRVFPPRVSHPWEFLGPNPLGPRAPLVPKSPSAGYFPPPSLFGEPRPSLSHKAPLGPPSFPKAIKGDHRAPPTPKAWPFLTFGLAPAFSPGAGGPPGGNLCPGAPFGPRNLGNRRGEIPSSCVPNPWLNPFFPRRPDPLFGPFVAPRIPPPANSPPFLLGFVWKGALGRTLALVEWEERPRGPFPRVGLPQPIPCTGVEFSSPCWELHRGPGRLPPIPLLEARIRRDGVEEVLLGLSSTVPAEQRLLTAERWGSAGAVTRLAQGIPWVWR